MGFFSETRCMKKPATKAAFNTAMIKATVMFPLRPRSTRETATVMIVPISSARKTPIYTFKCFLMSCECLSSIKVLKEIEHREQEDPNQINKVPEQPANLHAVRETHRIGPPHFRAGDPEKAVHHHASQNMQRVEAG